MARKRVVGKIVDKLKNRFGTTSNPAKSGYILPTGEFLNMNREKRFKSHSPGEEDFISHWVVAKEAGFKKAKNLVIRGNLVKYGSDVPLKYSEELNIEHSKKVSPEQIAALQKVFKNKFSIVKVYDAKVLKDDEQKYKEAIGKFRGGGKEVDRLYKEIETKRRVRPDYESVIKAIIKNIKKRR